MKKIIIILMITVFILSSAAARDHKRETEIMKKEIPLRGESEVEVTLDIGLAELYIIPGEPRNIVMAVIEYDPDKIKPVINYDEGRIGRLLIESRKKSDFGLRGLDENASVWKLGFTDRIPLDINIDFGLGEGELDFSGLKLNGMKIDAGLSDLKVIFDKPNSETIRHFNIDCGLGELTVEGLLNANFERFSYDGGLGSTELHFTGTCKRLSEAKISVGMGSVEIFLQRNLPVKVYYESSFLASVDLEDFKKLHKGEYVSDKWEDKTDYGLILELEVGMGAISVEWVD
ncbi:hypothetical protein ISS30_06275 [bacterium]|nr:hypothetical protein [FCB group bacterium]MBL7191285.1 hypothetical protein [bacterium]